MAKAFDQKVDNDGLLELTQAILGHVHRLPGNDKCADCDSEKGKIKVKVGESKNMLYDECANDFLLYFFRGNMAVSKLRSYCLY